MGSKPKTQRKRKPNKPIPISDKYDLPEWVILPSNVLRYIDPDEIKEIYPKSSKLADLFSHAIVETDDNIFRWSQLDVLPHIRYSLNDIWQSMKEGNSNLEHVMKFYMCLGYSLSSYEEVFSQNFANAVPSIKKSGAAGTGETMIDFILRQCAEEYHLYI